MELQQAFEEFKKLPDWNLYPLPEVAYKHFNIEKPKPSSHVRDVLYYLPPLAEYQPTETRPPAEGGVREIPTGEPLQITTEIVAEHQPETQKQSADSTESNETKTQQSVGHSNLPERDADSNTTVSELHLGAL